MKEKKSYKQKAEGPPGASSYCVCIPISPEYLLEDRKKHWSLSPVLPAFLK